ncbi:hypothetical protein M408DRAFT_174449 [Serendipita vermifera MAFF 305830]|uniref:Uncharacterized protein n=1 Tax=Serendipita vermifera MAFF 305830 TaxID=933852 RepID=A0A0C3AIB4_SERVB|nr:hypothetical protein M408DRAFT_174449 [Serendipita vermifera MAFF 305830]
MGGLAGLALLVLVIWWMRRQRQTEEDSLATAFDVSVDPSSREDPFTPATRSEDQVQTPAQWVDEAMRSAGPPLTVHSQSALSAIPPSQPELDDTSTEHLTYYTLPSYHENARQRTAARDLSEADVAAISRRLREVMRNQVGQPGGNVNGLVSAVDPREN